MKKISHYLLISGFALFILSGCVKHVNPPNTELSTTAAGNKSNTIMTPFGPRDPSQVHFVEPGHFLRYDKEGRLSKVETKTGRIIEEFGKQLPLAGVTALGNKRRTIVTGGGVGGATTPDLGSGWITYAENLNNVGPVTLFQTIYNIPTSPVGQDGQLLYIFNGLQDGFDATSHILQPVLQYGNNNAWGGYYWTINNWYASCQTCAAYYGVPQSLAAGTRISGVMEQTATSGGLYSYLSTFGYNSSNDLTVSNVPPLTYAFETVEAYNMQNADDYPPDAALYIDDITLQANGTNFTPFWDPVDAVTDIGQHTVILSNSYSGSPGGSMLLYFRNPPTTPQINGSTASVSAGLFHNNVPCLITAAAGTTVTVNAQLSLPRPGRSVSFTITTPGVTFSDGTTTLSASSTASKTFVMPAGGSITGTAATGGGGIGFGNGFVWVN